ncbi:MAG: ribonuclease R, partial [Gammaproteobacteria bacterium]|nr:ribonuclease R [Gammaproteobacteria bacterium]
MDNSRLRFVLDNPWQFIRRVLAGFSANQGFLLSGAVAYYTLLTIVPMFALIITGLSQIQEIQPLLESLREYLQLIAPNQADALI